MAEAVGVLRFSWALTASAPRGWRSTTAALGECGYILAVARTFALSPKMPVSEAKRSANSFPETGEFIPCQAGIVSRLRADEFPCGLESTACSLRGERGFSALFLPCGFGSPRGGRRSAAVQNSTILFSKMLKHVMNRIDRTRHSKSLN